MAGDDIINFSVAGTINLTGALPDLSSNIQILGPGAASLTVRRDTGGDYRIFTVAGGSPAFLLKQRRNRRRTYAVFRIAVRNLGGTFCSRDSIPS